MKCSKCGKEIGAHGKLVCRDMLCYDCYERLGGIDYKRALDELNKVKHGAGFPPPNIQREG